MKLAKMFFAAILFFGISTLPANATQQLSLTFGFTSQEYPQNVGGGLSYLTNGDVVGITSDYVNKPIIYEFDASGDKIPPAPQTIGSLALGEYGSFIRVSPDGTYALYGVTGGSADGINKIDLATFAVNHIADLTGNFDLAFLTTTTALISANVNYAPVNNIYYLDINNPSGMKVIAQFSGVPSGGITVNSNGDVYYVKSTYAYPAPPASYTLLKFTSAQIQNAINATTILGENDSQIHITLDGGYNVAVNSENDIYVASLSGQIYKINGTNQTVETFCSVANNPNGTFSNLGFYLPTQPFDPNRKSTSKLGVTFGDFTTSTFTFIEITPLKKYIPPKNILQY